MKQYLVVRILIKDGDNEIHSIEYFDELHKAEQRYFAIIGADINGQDTIYNAAFIIDRDGNMVRNEINDIREQKDKFYIVVRFFFKNDKYYNSIQYYPVDYDNPYESYKTALQRWFNIIAADLNDKDITANGAFIIDSASGDITDGRTFYIEDENNYDDNQEGDEE